MLVFYLREVPVFYAYLTATGFFPTLRAPLLAQSLILKQTLPVVTGVTSVQGSLPKNHRLMLPPKPFGQLNNLLHRACVTLFATTCVASVVLASDDEPKPARSDGGEPVWLSKPGPWGELEIRSIYLEAPDYLVAGLKQPNSTTAWNFPGASEAWLAALFTRAGLPEEVQAQLLNPQRILIHEGVWTLFADPSLLMALTLEQRSVIYKELATSPLNPMHVSPAYVPANNAEDWLSDAHLSDDQKQTVRKLLWKDHDMLAFSDVSILLAATQSDREVAKIFKFMTRVRSLVVNLKLSSHADWKPLAQYWTDEGREVESLPLLVSATERESMKSIDITHLLPPIARAHLYTFPSVDSGAEGRLPDCQWTALNFFNSVPHDYYLDARLTAARLHEAYEVVEGSWRYGDVLEFTNPQGDAVHACVYIADNIVLTKNGEGMIKPWVLMWLANVKKLYLREPGFRITGYRLKPSAS